MAEATYLRNNALPYPIYGAPWTVAFPILDADGDLVTGASSPDSEISKNGDGFSDCTNEATEIATSSGMYYLSLTGTELTCDVAAIIVKCGTSGAKTTPIVLYPRKLVTVRSGTSAGGDTAYITLDASASALDDYYNGMVCVATIDSNVECRVITDYSGSNQRATVTPAWNVAPDDNDTFIVYLPEGVQIPTANVTALSDDTTAANNAEAFFDGTGYAGTNNVIPTVTSVTGIANGGIAAASFAAGAINAAAIATGAIDADALAADAVDEILDEVVEGSYTVRQYLRLFAAALSGKSSGGGTATLKFRDTGDSKDRITATVDASKNRTAMTLDVS